MSSKTVRVVLPLVILGVSVIAYAAGVSTGTISQVGLGDLSLLCPLGAIAAMVASRTVIPRAVVSIVLSAVLFLLFGRLFCGWACPVPVVSRLRNLFRRSDAYIASHGQAGEGAPAAEAAPAGDADDASVRNAAPLTEEERALLHASCASCGPKRGDRFDSRHAVLIGALASTLIFGFPVFCIVCPIGLTFASAFLLFSLFAHAEVTWGVLIAPAVLLVEVVFFRKWCHTFCPLGALMSLTARLNRTFRPVRDEKKCLEERGVACGRCASACSEGIDLVYPARSEAAVNECTRCRACVEACPVGAVRIPPVHHRRPRLKGSDTQDVM